MIQRLLDRPVAVVMILSAAIVLGVVSLRMLPVSLMPDVDVPMVTVRSDEPSLSSVEMEETVLRPIRYRLMQVSGLEDLTTEARDGSGSITLRFSQGTDMDYAFIEVNEKIDRSMPELSGCQRPKVMRTGASDIPAFYLNMSLKEDGEDAFAGLSRFAVDVIAKRVEQLDEVAMADVSGIIDDEILVVPDVQALEGVGLDLPRFESIIRSANIPLGALTIRDGEYRYDVKFLSFAKSDKDIADIQFRVGDRLLKVKDVASVKTQPARRMGLVRSDGKNAISIAVIKQSSARMSDLRRHLHDVMAHFSGEYPDIVFTVTRDQTSLLDYSISSLLKNIMLAILLSVLVISFSMKDWKSSLLVGITIPVSLILSMLLFRLFGIGINIISLSGLILGVGMMVDNSIILVDNISGHLRRGEPRRDAVALGTKEVAGPMLSSVLTTCAVFLPLIFLSGTAGALFKDEALSISIVLLVSWVVTIVVLPVLHFHLPERSIIRCEDSSPLWEEKAMAWTLGHSWVSWAFLIVSLAGCACIFLVVKKEKLPEMSYTETILDIDWNEPVSVEENTSRTAFLESLVPDAVQITSLVGAQKFMLSHSGDLGVNESSIYMDFSSVQDMEEAKKVLSDNVRKSFPSASYGFKMSGNIFDMVFSDSEASLVARVRPLDSESMNPGRIQELLAKISNALPGVSIPSVAVKPSVVFTPDMEALVLYGVSLQALQGALKNAANQSTVFNMVQGERSVPVVVGTGRGDLSSLFETVVVRSSDNIDIPVSLLMRQSVKADFKTLTAGTEGLYYPVSLDVPYSEAKKTMEAVGQVVRENDGYEVGFSGSYFSNRKLFGEMAWVFVIAVLLLYLILASQFESLVQPVIILSEIVMDVFACLLLIWAAGMSLNLMTMIGLVVISGIVINDSILKVDTINKLRGEGMRKEEAIMVASRRRFKAIVMTSLTTVLSVLPFLVRGDMGSDLQYPMSVVIIVGMVVGTLVSLFVVPALYGSVLKDE